MTEKQKNILQAALELFAQEGFTATSTNRIAKRAGVSEGLIFRHYGNKDGLLQAILKDGEERAKVIFADIVFETEPIEVIRKTLNLGQKMIGNQSDADFWKLQYKIKWEIEQYSEQKLEPLEQALTAAFNKLGYKSPEWEARFLLVSVDGLATRYFLQENFDLDSMIQFLKEKYLS